MPPPIKVLRLYPGPAVELPAEEAYSDLRFPTSRSAEGPYVAINMVSTLDGKAAIGGKASPIGSRVDREIMRSLRSAFDAVVVGAGTVRAEELNLTVTDKLAEKRKAQGLREQPLGVVLAGTGDLPLERKLFHSRNVPIILSSPSTPEKTVRKASAMGIRVISTEEQGLLLVHEVLRLLRGRLGVRTALLEGGPAVNGAFLSSGAVDELFLTLSPKLSRAHGGNQTIASPGGPGPELTQLDLASVHASPQEGELYLRYWVRPEA